MIVGKKKKKIEAQIKTRKPGGIQTQNNPLQTCISPLCYNYILFIDFCMKSSEEQLQVTCLKEKLVPSASCLTKRILHDHLQK